MNITTHTHLPSYPSKSLTILIDEFVKQFRDRGRDNTARAYRSDIKQFFDFAKIETTKQLATIGFSDMVELCEDFLASIKKVDPNNPKIITNARTLNRKAYSLKKFFNFLSFGYNYPKNPLGNYSPYRVNKTTTTTPLTERELLNIIHHSDEECKRASTPYSKLTRLQKHLIICFLALSLRREEVALLQREHINHDEKYILVRQKGGTIKHIPMPETIHQKLINFKKRKDNHGITNPFIFSSIKTKEQQKPISSTYVHDMVISVCKKLKINKHITPHSFRTTFVKRALERGLPLIDIMNATGHHSVEIVKYYDTRHKNQSNAINQMSDMFD